MTDEQLPHADRAYREARRAAARAHHPDAGGDAQALIDALRAVDARYARSSSVGSTRSTSSPIVGLSRRSLLTRRLKAVRSMLPSRRTYIDLPRTDIS